MQQRSFSAEFPNDNPALWLCAAPQRAEPEVADLVSDDSDDFARLIQVLVETALLSGATRAAAQVSSVLADETRAQPEHRALAGTARAWRAVLAGQGDLGACGDASLDEWAADLLATLMGAPEKRADLRRELRSRGVAAFGLVARAA